MGDDYKYAEYIVGYDKIIYSEYIAEHIDYDDYDAQLDNIPLSKIESYLRKKKLKNIESI